MSGYTAQEKEKIEKIVNMMLYEIPQSQIALAVGLSEARISEIITQDDYYKEKYEVERALKFEQAKTLNDAYDLIEEKTAEIILKNLDYNKDARFALQAMMVANKMQRRMSPANKPLDAGTPSTVVVLKLTQRFVDKRVQTVQVAPEQVKQLLQDGERQSNNILTPQRVGKLLDVDMVRPMKPAPKTAHQMLSQSEDIDVLFAEIKT